VLCGVKINEPPFASRYPEVAAMLGDEPAKPKGNVVRHNIFWQGRGEDLRRVANGQPIGETWWKHVEDRIEPLVTFDANLINEDPRCADEARGDFRLRSDSPAWRTGFQAIPRSRSASALTAGARAGRFRIPRRRRADAAGAVTAGRFVHVTLTPARRVCKLQTRFSHE
jgi:hypothetical protein